MDYFEICDACLEHVIGESKHEWCNQFCRPPFHTGGGTYAETPEFQHALMEAATVKHTWNCCLKTGCPPGHKYTPDDEEVKK